MANQMLFCPSFRTEFSVLPPPAERYRFLYDCDYPGCHWQPRLYFSTGSGNQMQATLSDQSSTFPF